eukprot:scaffold34399_cov54-Cyclotella_meneghiniana.AAC.6
MDNEFQSHPCFHIQYTYNEILEQSSCCDVGGMIPSHAILSWCGRWGYIKPTFYPAVAEVVACGDCYGQ